jgi:hypothetical protein
MRTSFRLLVLAAVGLLAFPLAAGANHANSPSTKNMHAMGESFRAASFLDPEPLKINSDLAFQGKHAYQGSYDGFRIVDISAPGNPKQVAQVQCNGNQGDVIVWGKIVVRTVDRPQDLPNNDLDRACEGTNTATGNTPGFEGLQIFEVDDVKNASADDLVAAVPTDCGAHTATLAPDPANNRLVVYVSVGSNASGPTPYGTTCFTPRGLITAVGIPLDDPSAAAVINNAIPASANGCHDVTAHVGEGVELLAGACRPEAVIWDISDRANPVVLRGITEPFTGGWHSAALTWDGKVLAMGWEPGGGGRPACQETGAPLVPPIAGNAFQTDEMKSIFFYDVATGQRLGMWTLPRPQSDQENCTIHNYNVVPTDKRYVLVNGNYQAGTSVVDFTDPANAFEVGYSDPAPIVPTQLGGAWSSYWYNGAIYESDITTGLRVYKLSDRATAGAMKFDRLNPQTQEIAFGLKG